MNGLERRLIELNSALLKLSTVGESPNNALLNRAHQAISGAYIHGTDHQTTTTARKNHLIVIDNYDEEMIINPASPTGEDGNIGDTDPTGQHGDAGPVGPANIVISTINDITVTGPTGSTGLQGATGPTGPVGSSDASVVINSTSHATFGSIDVIDSITSNGKQLITDVIPIAGEGIVITDVLVDSPIASFTIINDGVVRLNPSYGIGISDYTGNISLTNTGVILLTSTYGIGLSSASGHVDVSNTGVTRLSSDIGIALSSETGNIVVTNTGVTTLHAGHGISLSNNTGNVTINSIGTNLLKTLSVKKNYPISEHDLYIGVNSNSDVDLKLPFGKDGKQYIIKNESGYHSKGMNTNTIHKINIIPEEGELIDGRTYYTLNSPYASINIVYRSGTWYTI